MNIISLFPTLQNQTCFFILFFSKNAVFIGVRKKKNSSNLNQSNQFSEHDSLFNITLFDFLELVLFCSGFWIGIILTVFGNLVPLRGWVFQKSWWADACSGMKLNKFLSYSRSYRLHQLFWVSFFKSLLTKHFFPHLFQILLFFIFHLTSMGFVTTSEFKMGFNWNCKNWNWKFWIVILKLKVRNRTRNKTENRTRMKWNHIYLLFFQQWNFSFAILSFNSIARPQVIKDKLIV